MSEIVVKVICENTGAHVFVNMGVSLLDVLKMISLRNDYPFLAAFVNNSLKELDYKVYDPVSVRFIDITHFEGVRVFQRTLFFTMNKAVHDVFPGNRFRIKHSVSKGFYCEIDGKEDITQQEIDRIKMRMVELVDQDIPIVRQKILTSEAQAMYEKQGQGDKLSLLKSRPHLYVTIYNLVDMPGYFYGALTLSTRYLYLPPKENCKCIDGICSFNPIKCPGGKYLFDLRKYYNGIYLAVPMRSNPKELENMVHQDKMFDIFKEYKAWVDVMGVSNIGSLNNKIIEGHSSELIKIAEAFHEKKLGNIADSISEAHNTRGARLVLISGPSSSGKTTFAKRLGIQLRILGLNPVLISLDDYFVDRELTPRDEAGEYDYEALEAIDVEAFNRDLKTLFSGGSVDVPRYDFITGKREYHPKPLSLDSRSLLVVEGIHGLNPKLTKQVPESNKFKIYISAFTSVSMDDLSRISTTDNRLLRRIVRDNNTRGSDATATLKRWESVRRGEDKHIFPYQENADVMFNSSLFYEISVLRSYIEPMLHEVPDSVPEYGEARRLLKFIDNFTHIATDEIPPTSILREFISGSSFIY